MTEKILQAVRAYCIECSGGSRKDVDGCNRHTCPLYPYRNRKAVESASPAKAAQLDGQINIIDVIELDKGGRKTWAH